MYWCRYSDPNSASSSFSILLGDAPHLDGEVLLHFMYETYFIIENPNVSWLLHHIPQYAIFGRVTKGEDTLKRLEEVPTRREGIFVMVCWFIFYLLIFLVHCYLWYYSFYPTENILIDFVLLSLTPFFPFKVVIIIGIRFVLTIWGWLYESLLFFLLSFI